MAPSGAAWRRGNVISVLPHDDIGATNLQVSLESRKVQANGTLVEISVATNFETGVTENRCVVSP